MLAFIAGSQTRGASSPDPLSPNAAAQIQALIDEKRTWTPTQQKVHSNLLYEAKQRRGLPIAPGVPTLETGIEVGPAGEVVVDITATVTSSFLDTLASLGGQVLDSHPAYRSVRAVLALDAVETLAAHPDVIFINRKQEDMLNRAGPLAAEPEAPGITASLSSAVRPGFAARAAQVRSPLSWGREVRERDQPRSIRPIPRKVWSSTTRATRRLCSTAPTVS